MKMVSQGNQRVLLVCSKNTLAELSNQARGKPIKHPGQVLPCCGQKTKTLGRFARNVAETPRPSPTAQRPGPKSPWPMGSCSRPPPSPAPNTPRTSAFGRNPSGLSRGHRRAVGGWWCGVSGCPCLVLRNQFGYQNQNETRMWTAGFSPCCSMYQTVFWYHFFEPQPIVLLVLRELVGLPKIGLAYCFDVYIYIYMSM